MNKDKTIAMKISFSIFLLMQTFAITLAAQPLHKRQAEEKLDHRMMNIESALHGMCHLIQNIPDFRF